MHVEHFRRGVARSKANAIVKRKIRDIKSILRAKFQDSSRKSVERSLLEATVGINISCTEFELSAVEKLFLEPWIFQKIIAKQICGKNGVGVLVVKTVWIKQETPDLAEALYQGKGIVTKQVSASTVEVKISGDGIKTYHVKDLLF